MKHIKKFNESLERGQIDTTKHIHLVRENEEGGGNLLSSNEILPYKAMLNEHKQETLEEVAEIFVNNRFTKQICGDEFYPDIHASKEAIVESHVLFTKWQAERMYSEEEVYRKLHNLMTDIKLYGVVINDDIDLKKWFNQFKKK